VEKSIKRRGQGHILPNMVEKGIFFGVTGTREWHIVKTRGHPVKGGYGHSSALDPYSELIYVYGGFKSDRGYNPFLSNHLYSYDPASNWWYVFRFIMKLLIGQSKKTEASHQSFYKKIPPFLFSLLLRQKNEHCERNTASFQVLWNIDKVQSSL